MRPRRLTVDHEISVVFLVADRRASMRPRRLTVDHAIGCEQASFSILCFNEATAFNRGSLPVASHQRGIQGTLQ